MTEIKKKSPETIERLKQEKAMSKEWSPVMNPPIMPFEFTKTEKKDIKSLFIVIKGQTSTLKTSFICSAPDPIYIFDFDNGLDGVVDRWIDAGKDIKHVTIGVIAKESLEENQAQADEVWSRFKKTYYEIVEDNSARTIGIDTGTHLWEIAQWSELGKIEIARADKKDTILPFYWGKVNQQFRSLMQKALDCDKNVIVTHRMKEEWEAGGPTGKYKLAGFKDMEFESKILIETVTQGSLEMIKPVYMLKKCRGAFQQKEGTRYEGYDKCNFPYIASDITGTPIEQWQ